MAANNIARLGVVLGLDSAEFVKGLDSANKKLYDFGENVAGKATNIVLAMGAAFVAATATAMKFADEIADVAKANDVAIDTIIKLNNALANSGGNAEDAGKLLAGFTKYIDNAASGSFEAQKALGKLGISLKDVANLSTEDLFKKIVQSIANIEDPLTRNARAMEIFGKAAKGVDFLGVAEEMDKVNSTTAQQAQAIQDAADAFDLLNQAARDVKFTMTTEIGTSIKQTTDYFIDLFSTINTGGGLWKTVFDKMAYGVSFMAFEVKDLIRVMGAWGDAFTAISQGRFGDIDKIAQARMKAREADEAKLFYLGEQLDFPASQRNNNVSAPRRPGQTNAGVGRIVTPGIDAKGEQERKKQHDEWKRFSAEQVKYIDDLIAKQTAEANEDIKRLDERNAALKRNGEEEIAIIQAIVDADEARAIALAAIESAQLDARVNQELKQKAQQNDLERTQQMFKLEQAGVTLRAEDLQMQRELFNLENKHKDALEEINRNKLLDADARQRAIETENELYQKGIGFIKERNRILKEGSVIDGFTQAMERFINNLPTQLQRGEQMFASFSDTIGQAIDQFVEKGTVAWDRLIENMIKGMIKAELQRQATSLFSSGFKALSGGNIFSSIFSFLGFADGGNPPVNTPSMVGERGPELFVPKTAGTIIPNNQLAAMGGGQTVNYNGPYIANMSAIDTQSGVQFLAKNKQAVWATYQSANRSIPMSR
jgi:hypothetical protein